MRTPAIAAFLIALIMFFPDCTGDRRGNEPGDAAEEDGAAANGLDGAEKLTVFPLLHDPHSLAFDSTRIYITEAHRIYIYSRDDFRLLKLFGRSGEEPDAFRPGSDGSVRLRLDVQSDDILAGSFERISIFSKQGEFKEILDVSPQVDYVARMGPRFLGSAWYIHVGTGQSTQHILLSDENLEFKTEIAGSHLGGGSAKGFGGPDRKMHIDLIPDYFGFRIYDGRIYVGHTTPGFHIQVFDAGGDRLYEISREYEKLKVTERYRQKRMAEIQELSTYKRYRDFIVVDEREYFPAFQNLWVSDARINALTYKRAGGGVEMIVLDLQGKEMGMVIVPEADVAAVAEGRYFFMSRNELAEWELWHFPLDAHLDVQLLKDQADDSR